MAKASEIILEAYKSIVEKDYPEYLQTWPMLCGYDLLNGEFDGYIISIFFDTKNPSIMTSKVVSFSTSILGVQTINENNIESVRKTIRQVYHLDASDAVVILNKSGENLNSEIGLLYSYHKAIMGLEKMKIFLSHRGIDKERVRLYKRALEIIGFSPWLDEDALTAGIGLERGIKQGFIDSCAAVFFITPNFHDVNYLATEIEYAIIEKRKKGDRFSIIALILSDEGHKGTIPTLLESYVWKEPSNDLEGLTEIIRALPLQIGQITYK